MIEEFGKPVPWSVPVQSTPLKDILALKAGADAAGVPIGSPDAFPSVAELLDEDGRRSGILVRVPTANHWTGSMKRRPEYPDGG